MRFAIVRQHYDPDGTVERVVERALEALLERNVAITLVTRAWPTTRLQLIEPSICNPFHVGSLWRDWGFARAACRLIRRANPTLVEAHEPLLCCDVFRAGDGVHAARLEARLRRASAIGRAAIRLSPRDRYLLRTERRMFASPWLRAVVCGSKTVRDDIRRRFGLPDAKLRVVRDPVDAGVFHPGLRAGRAVVLERHAIAPGALVCLLLAPDPAQAGVDTALAGLAAAPAPAHLVVVGGDAGVESYRRQARRLGVEDRVTFAGGHEDRRSWYGAADALVVPESYRPSLASVQEAMACGLAIVASTTSGAAELVRDHDAGTTFAPDDPSALATQIDALRDPATRARFSANARAAAAAWSPAATTLQLVLLYRELLSGAAPTGGGLG